MNFKCKISLATFDCCVEAGQEEGGEVGAEAGVDEVIPHPLIRHPPVRRGAVLGSLEIKSSENDHSYPSQDLNERTCQSSEISKKRNL